MGRIENDAFNISSVGAYIFVVAVTFLPSLCIATMGDTHIDTQTDGRDL
jgi:hypothetical protein